MSEPPPIPRQQQNASQNPKLGDDAGIRMLLPVGRSGWAIAAGYLGLFSMILVPAPIALIVSIIAIVDVQKSKGTANVKRGMGRAVFGLIMGIIFTVILVTLVVTTMSPE